MDTVENAKKRMLREGSLMRQATIRMKKEKESSPATQPTSFLEGIFDRKTCFWADFLTSFCDFQANRRFPKKI